MGLKRFQWIETQYLVVFALTFPIFGAKIISNAAYIFGQKSEKYRKKGD